LCIAANCLGQSMKRSLFLSFAAFVALVVGAFALAAPSVLLATKGVSGSAAEVWVREVGALLIAIGVTVFTVRNHEDSPTLRALLIGNALVQIGLFPIEVLAYYQGVIPLLSGILPNSIVHLLLAAGFVYYAANVQMPGSAPAPSAA
jgi:hypothetical protein